MSEFLTLILNFGCLWIVLSLLVAWRATAFGHSYFKFLLLSLVLSPVVGACWLLAVGVNERNIKLCEAGHLILKGAEGCDRCDRAALKSEEQLKVKEPKVTGTSICKACGQRYKNSDARCEWCGFPTQRGLDWHMIPPE